MLMTGGVRVLGIEGATHCLPVEGSVVRRSVICESSTASQLSKGHFEI